MKTIRLFVLALLLPAFVMVGCDKGDETPKDPESSTPGVPEAGSGIVSKIELTDRYGDVMQGVNFTYDSYNRLIRVEFYGETTESVYLSYETGSQTAGEGAPYTIIRKYVSEYGEETTTFTVGNSGYVESGEYSDRYTDRYYYYTYNDSGYLTNSSTTDYYNNTYTWIGGNLTRISKTDLDYPDEELVYDFEYAEVANNPLCNLDLNKIALLEEDSVLELAGLCGKRSANRVAKLIRTCNEDPDGDYELSFAYETDPKGFVTKITVNYNGVEAGNYLVFYN
ncbi:MAG: hypothetical protein LBM20_05860 [Rikenellaceae bacterium]|jgi:hypothetical protein|nr:hypothetical protein [Rikenellaceae bacterium]